MSKKTNHKNLARKQARIREARRKAYRKRRMILTSIIGVGVFVFAVFMLWPLVGGGDEAEGDTSAVGTSCSDINPTDAKTFDEPFDTCIDPNATYTADIATSMGLIRIRLLPEAAPNAVNNFVSLAKSGFYDGLTFHRVINGFMIQGGDPNGDGSGGPGYTFPDELTGKEKYPVGTVAMANAGPNTNGSQFFIVTGPQAKTLTPTYVVFGEVIEGQGVADRISSQQVMGEMPVRPVRIDSLTVEETAPGAQT